MLATKLHVPPSRTSLVRRSRLIERLNEGQDHKLTLIAAPAGFGKTTLLSEWVSEIKRPIAWLSLDAGDNDPAQFLAYLIAALQTIAPHLGEGVLTVLQSPQQPPTETILTALLNEITALATPFVLILDDYHLIDATAVDLALSFVLEHLPPQMHLTIASREDPQLPLARLRARSQLTELRAGDLRFTPDEAAEFLHSVMGLDLSAADITILEDRTEGWIAGLQLVGLSMRGREDISGFIQGFAGNHRYIVDYLVEEVLQRQPETVRNFLFQTAVLERFSGPLCEAVTGQKDGNAKLESLERGNFFVVPLDDQRHWYRYHHLFAEVLRVQLMTQHPEQVAVLHLRASQWYEQQGSVAEAIHHALAAEEFGRAANLIETALPQVRKNRQETTMLRWLAALPEAVMRTRPVLSVHSVGVFLQIGDLESAQTRLRDVERWLEIVGNFEESSIAPPTAMVVIDEKEFQVLPGSIAMYRAAIALALGDLESSMNYARQVLDLVPEEDHLKRGAAISLLGLAYWTRGNLEAAHRTFSEGMVQVQMAGFISDAIGGTIALADIRLAQGRLHDAMRTYERGLQLASSWGTPVLRGAADMHVGMSGFYFEQNDLNAARQHLQKSKELGEFAGFPQNPYRSFLAMARVCEVEGDLEGALRLIEEAERVYVADFFPQVRPIAALKARMWAVQGRWGEALGWVRTQSLSADDDLSYLREFEHITLARVLLARFKSDRTNHTLLEPIGLLKRLQQAAQAGERTGSLIEILMLQALAHHVQGNISAAFVPLEHALMLAEPEGYFRIFVGEGLPMVQLLLEAAARGIMPDYTGKLLAACEAEKPRSDDQHSPPKLSAPALASQFLLVPLSERELEVLVLIAQGLSNREISKRLFRALDTIKGHNRNIFSKLQTQNRTEAVARARELGLL
jgi:LuxR family maltose regulon positive regulatory protein